MRAVLTGLVCLAASALAGACSLAVDGDHFLADPASPDAGADRPDSGADPPDAEAPDPDPTCGETCPGDDCDLSCPSGGCACELDCAATSGKCKPKCEHRDCAIDCRQVDTCEVSCKDAGCDIDCTGADHCDHVKCEEESGCLLDCSGAERCDFERCDGEVTSCPGDLLACNRACP